MTTTPAFDLDRARRETPGCKKVLSCISITPGQR